MVRPRRLELPRIAPQAPQACVSTNSTMAAIGVILSDFSQKRKGFFGYKYYSHKALAVAWLRLLPLASPELRDIR